MSAYACMWNIVLKEKYNMQITICLKRFIINFNHQTKILNYLYSQWFRSRISKLDPIADYDP